MKTQDIPMRTESSKAGLLSMIEWINTIRPTKNMTMIEIGSYAGDSTEIFCRNFAMVIAVDPWASRVGGITDAVDMDVVYDKFIERMKKFDNLDIRREYSYNECIKFKAKSVDFVYIDGLHTYIASRCDIANYEGKIRPKGFLAGHDYHAKKFPGVVKAVEEYRHPEKVFADTSWIIRK